MFHLIVEKEFNLKQFHFHVPSESEHHIDGKSFAMEAHLVHNAEDGSLAVIAVLFDEEAANETLAQLREDILEKTENIKPLSATISMPRNYYHKQRTITELPDH